MGSTAANGVIAFDHPGFADKERYTVTAYDFAGELQWRRVLGPYQSQHGLGASPIVFEDLLIVPNDQDGPSSVLALNRHSGRTVWSRLRRFKTGRTSYATPLVIREDDDDVGRGGFSLKISASGKG